MRHTGPALASEDFGCFGTAWPVPSVFWFDPKIYADAKAAGELNELPVSHSPQFAPVRKLAPKPFTSCGFSASISIEEEDLSTPGR
jgi:hypothetical protein